MPAPPLGVQTVEIGEPVEGVADRWGTAEKSFNWTPIQQCRFRPLSVAEVVELYDRNVEIWKWTAPPHSKLLAAKPNWRVRYNGVIYEIDGGIRPFDGPDGLPFKVTVLCKVQQARIA